MKRDRRKASLRLALGALLLTVTGCLGGVQAHGQRVSSVESDPSGASVFIKGGFVGMTPAAFYMPAQDRVDIRLELPGYVPKEDVLVRSKDLPENPEEGVGWEEVYYFQLIPKGR